MEMIFSIVKSNLISKKHLATSLINFFIELAAVGLQYRSLLNLRNMRLHCGCVAVLVNRFFCHDFIIFCDI